MELFCNVFRTSESQRAPARDVSEQEPEITMIMKQSRCGTRPLANVEPPLLPQSRKAQRRVRDQLTRNPIRISLFPGQRWGWLRCAQRLLTPAFPWFAAAESVQRLGMDCGDRLTRGCFFFGPLVLCHAGNEPSVRRL